MSDGSANDESTTYTQEQVDQMVEERNKALEAKRDEILTELKAAKDKLKAYDGVDPSEHRKLQAKLTELEHQRKAQEKGIQSEDLVKMRQEIRQDLDKEYGPIKQQLEEAQKEVRTLRLDNVVKMQMSKAGVRGERVDALYRLTGEQFDLTDDGQPMVKERPGTEVHKYIEGLADEYPEFFLGSGSSGGGASKSAGSAGGPAKTISLGDPSAFLANLEGIAGGSVKVVE